jgi:hypothetical protein
VIPVPPGPHLPPDQPTWSQQIPGTVEQFGRILDPAKAAALEQAVMLVGLAARGRVASQTERVSEDLAQLGGATLAIADEFEAWLTGAERPAEEDEEP